MQLMGIITERTLIIYQLTRLIHWLQLSIVPGIVFTLSSAATAYPAHLVRVSKLQSENEDINLEDGKAIEMWKEEGTILPGDDERIKESESKVKQPVVSKSMWKVAYVLNVVFQVVGGILELIATFFGPVSIVTPICVASGIISSMVIFSYILKIEEKPSKDTIVGTCK